MLKLSVVTVCFNSEKTISATVESFLAQDYKNKELIIVDGASSDQTLQIVRGFNSSEVKIFSEKDRGIFHAMTKGLSLFTGDAIGYLNSDDWYASPNILSAIAEGLGRADIVYGGINFVRSRENRSVIRAWKPTEKPLGGFRSGWMPPHPAFYVKRYVAEAVGAFDESMAVAADYDWMLRAVECFDYEVAKIDRIFVEMLPGGNSTRGIQAFLRGNIESLRSRRRWLDAGFVDYAFFAKPTRKLAQIAVKNSA